MPRKIVQKRPLPLSEVKSMLEQRTEGGEFNYTQRVALDHATKFSRLSSESTKTLLDKLQNEFGLDLDASVQICNIVPETVEELKIVTSERYSDLDNTKLEAIIKCIEEIGG